MKPRIHERKLRPQVAQVTFGALALLTALALVMAVAGSNGIAQAQLQNSPGGGKAAPNPPFQEKIAFVRVFPPSDSEIYTMNPDGSNPTALTTGSTQHRYPAWSPDGSKVAFSRFDYSTSTGDIRVINADASGEHVIRSGMYSHLSWSPDGSRIAFGTNNFDGTNDIYVMNSDGSGTIQLTTDTTASFNPAWSPDGSKFAFVNSRRDNDGDCEIYVMNSDGSNQHMIADPPRGNNYLYPAWSPDGTKIAFMGGPTAAVYTMNPDGSNISQVPNTVGQDGLAWSPDGLRIVYQCTLDAQAHVCVINTDGSNLHNISGTSMIACNCDWQHGTPHVVLVQNEQGTPVPGAQVYTNTNGPSYPSTFVGTTGVSGTLALPNAQVNEYVIARTLVYTGTTNKAAHDGWAYHVWLTDIEQQIDGRQSAYVITDTGQLTQTVVVSRDKPLIGFNIVASVEYNATSDNLSQIATGFAGSNTPQGFRLNSGANDYLLDVTDGQMFIEKVRLYEDKQNWGDADYQFFAYYPRADTGCSPSCGPSSVTSTSAHVHAQGSGSFGIPWDQTNGYATLIHEFGHYAIGAYDEYKWHYDGDPATCSLSPDPDYQLRASIMDHQAYSSEFCTQDNHNPQTAQGLLNGESVWQTLKRNWNDNSGPNRWSIQSPIERGFVDRGPLFFLSHEADETDVAQAPSGNASCAPIAVTVTLNGSPVVGASLSLTHNGYSINEGVTGTNGKALIYGAETARDTVEARGSGFPGQLYTGSADITSCDAITIPLSIFLGDADQPNTQWPTHWLTATADFSQNQVHTTLHFTADPPSQPALFGSQGGTNRQQISLTYDPVGHNYTGDYPFNPNISLDFQFEVGLSGAQGMELFPYTFDAAQFHASGPDIPNKGDSPPGDKLLPTSPTPAPSMWDLFPPENMVSVSISSTSLISGTGVMVGQVDSPDPLNGLLAVGGPYSIQGENPIVGTVYVSLEYQSEYFCGLQAGSITVYRYNGAGWDALPSTHNEEWHLAATTITQWGIYAVFAQPNPQAVFSDVPPGSTFYDYINWITCHGIASGYADGTFRPNDNATRGQISKMVANAYQWHLDPPSTGGYTFADVLPGSTFFLYIEAAFREGVVSGYPCGGPSEPCDPNQRPYFRPNTNVTRGQISKIISNASHFNETPTGQSFEDVPPTHTFYEYIERMASRGIINGYACGGPGQPCIPPSNRPYFRPGSNASRGQLSKMIYLALQPR